MHELSAVCFAVFLLVLQVFLESESDSETKLVQALFFGFVNLCPCWFARASEPRFGCHDSFDIRIGLFGVLRGHELDAHIRPLPTSG